MSQSGTWHKVIGEGPPVVLIHGVGLDASIWRQQIVALNPHHQVIVYDMWGHGQSPDPAGERNLDDFLGQLEQLLDDLGIEKASVVGFSMGGLVSRAFAEAHPDRMDKLVLLSTVFRRTDDQQKAVLARYEAARAGEQETNMAAALERWFTDAYAGKFPDEIDAIRKRLEKNDPQAFLKAYGIFATTRDTEGPLSISCPTLVATGELDSGSTPEMAKALAAAIKGAELSILAGLKHMVPVEGAEVLNQLLLRFLGPVNRSPK